MSKWNRREFLELTLVSASGLLAGACGSEAADGRSPAAPGRDLQDRFFPQSVASGDPRPTSVVVWARVVDEARPADDLELTLTVALDEEMRQTIALGGEPSVSVTARARNDHCVKVRVDWLEPGTTYYYRFQYEREGAAAVPSAVARTRTAPAEDADAKMRFAVVSCQDYDRGYYHLYRLIAGRELDFVVHLGDYVYETTNDANAGRSERQVLFQHPEDALQVAGSALGSAVPGELRLAARSLDNYRDLYRTVRSDPDLRRLHERFPMIVISDDHEFSNDCYGATGNYEDGRTNETDQLRRAASDQAWSEYMPVDWKEPPAVEFSSDAPFPEDLTFFRRFVFGQHVELVMTDLRRYRPDHVVPENAFPGALFATEDEIPPNDELVPIPSIDVDSEEFRAYGEWLRERAEALGFRAEALSGRLSVPFVNAQLAAFPSGDRPEPIGPETPDLVRGYAYHQLLKSAEFSSAGSRYLVGAAAFEALARQRFLQTNGASERMMGDAQRTWFLETLQSSNRTFKLWGSSLCFMSKQIDMRGAELVPENLRARILVTAEDWDGCPNERRELLRALAGVENLVILSGDLHCFLVGTPYDSVHPDTRVVEIVTGAVSSSPWLKEIRAVVEANPSLPEGVAFVASAIGSFLDDPLKRPNPHLAFQDVDKNGLTLVTVDGDALEAELLLLPQDLVAESPSVVGNLVDRVTSHHFRVLTTGELERDLDGRAWQWDPETGAWTRA